MKDESLAMELIRDGSKRNKRTFIALLVVIFLWFATILSFVYFINQFDFVTETTTLDGDGTNNYIENGGSITNGN